MGVFRVKKDSNYTVINNTCLRDPNISWKAKGLHAYMVSMPDDWTFYNEDLVKRAPDGKDSLKAAIRELTKAGYLQRKRKHDEKGRFSGWETIVYEVPQPKAENPTDGKPDGRENRQTENPPLPSTDSNEVLNSPNTDKKKKDNVALAPSLPFLDIVDYLNEKAGTKYRASSKKTQNLIKARFNEGFTLDDFKTVIDKKTAEWLTDQKMNQYLRPETLFGTKFESYLNQKGGQAHAKTKKHTDLSQYNFDKEPDFDF